MKKRKDLNLDNYINFYDLERTKRYDELIKNQKNSSDYRTATKKNDTNYELVKNFIDDHKLYNKKILEIGSSGGHFQNIVKDYTGVDVAESLKKYYSKPYYAVKDNQYPFEDDTFDAIFTLDTFEHIPDINHALIELVRVLKPGGLILFKPAWQCRSWAADGYNVRPYSDFNLVGKMIKFSIIFRENIIYRSLKIFPKRIFRHLFFLLGFKQSQLKYRRIKPNYTYFWTSDSDACNSIDGHDCILWFMSKNLKCINYPNILKQLLFRNNELIIQKI